MCHQQSVILALLMCARYAIERTSSFIKVWFWSRAADGIPSDVMNGSDEVNTDNWVGLEVF